MDHLKDFYSIVGEGNRSFIAKKCSNANGHYMALVEYYRGGNKHKFIFIPKDKMNQGCQWLAEALWVAVAKGRYSNLNRGVAPLRSLVLVFP